jgi:hypothetical protein
MNALQWKESDSQLAEQIWSDYQRAHDVSQRRGQTAGIEPKSRRVWFGNSIKEVVAGRNDDGCQEPLYFVRVGFPTYYRKGGRR